MERLARRLVKAVFWGVVYVMVFAAIRGRYGESLALLDVVVTGAAFVVTWVVCDWAWDWLKSKKSEKSRKND